MLRKTILPTIQSIATGQKATLDMPLGIRIHAIWLEFSDAAGAFAQNFSAIDTCLDAFATDIRVKLNGHTQREHTPKQLNQINGSNGAQYNAINFVSGTANTATARVRLPIYFKEPWRADTIARDLPAWNVDAGQNSFQIEIDVKSGLVTPNITGWYEWEPLRQDVNGGKLAAVTKMFRQSLPALGGSNDFSIRNVATTGFLQSIHFFPITAANYVNKVRLRANGSDVQDLIDAGQNAALLRGSDLLPDTTVAPRFDLVLDYDDPLNSALRLDGLSSLDLQTQYAAAGVAITNASGSIPTVFVVAGRPE